MKAEDIRVGDYLMVEPSKMVIKIAAIHNKKVGYHAVTNRLEWVKIGLLRPIPITRAFLVKNKIVNDIDTPTCKKDSKGKWIIHPILLFDGATWMLTIQYVHELQQYLRLMGEKKKVLLATLEDEMNCLNVREKLRGFTSVWHEASEKPQGFVDEEILVQFNDLSTDVFELEDYEYLDNVVKWAFTKDLLYESK